MGSTKTKTKSGPVPNEELEHTRGGATTRDSMDAGVPMTPGQPDEPVGPEDAFGPGPKRGDYSVRITSGPSMVTRVIPEDERRKRAAELVKGEKGASVDAALGDVPRTELVPAAEAVADVGDAPGKGGVSTEAARETVAEEADVEA